MDVNIRRTRIGSLMAELAADLTRAGDIDWVSSAATAYQESLDGLRTRIGALENLLEDLDGELTRLGSVRDEVDQVHARLDAVDDAMGHPWL